MLLWTNRLSRHTFTVEIASSNLVGSTKFGLLAQLEEALVLETN